MTMLVARAEIEHRADVSLVRGTLSPLRRLRPASPRIASPGEPITHPELRVSIPSKSQPSQRSRRDHGLLSTGPAASSVLDQEDARPPRASPLRSRPASRPPLRCISRPQSRHEVRAPVVDPLASTRRVLGQCVGR